MNGESDAFTVVGLSTKPPPLGVDDPDALGTALPPNVSAVVDAFGGSGAAGVAGADGVGVKLNDGAGATGAGDAAGLKVNVGAALGAAALASVFAYSSAYRELSCANAGRRSTSSSAVMRERSVSIAETNETMFSPRRAISRCVSASSAAVPFADAAGCAAGAPNEKPANAGLGAAGAGALAGVGVKEKPPNCVVRKHRGRATHG